MAFVVQLGFPVQLVVVPLSVGVLAACVANERADIPWAAVGRILHRVAAAGRRQRTGQQVQRLSLGAGLLCPRRLAGDDGDAGEDAVGVEDLYAFGDGMTVVGARVYAPRSGDFESPSFARL